MQMNDAHIYCTEEQFEKEFNAMNEMYLKYFKIFGIEKYLMRFSTHDPSQGGSEVCRRTRLWLKTEDMVRSVLNSSGINYIEVPNEAAFYGPKIDVQIWSAIGREFTIATNQVDFAVPKRFGLVYKDRDNTEKISAVHPSCPARHVTNASSDFLLSTTPATSRFGSPPSRFAS